MLFFFGLLFQGRAQNPAGQANEVSGLGPEPDQGYKGSFHFGVTTAINSTWIRFDTEAPDNGHYPYNKTFK
jgi:hypothetical protein